MPKEKRDDIEKSGQIGRAFEKMPEFVKRFFLLGLGTLLFTEEGIKNVLKEMKMPRDVIRHAGEQANRTKKELFEVLTRELRGFLKQMNISQEIKRALSGLEVKISTEVTFSLKDEGGLKTNVRPKARVSKK